MNKPSITPWSDEADDRLLPAAIRERIQRQQDESERLIGWIQLAIILTFAALYVFSQRNAPQLSEAWILTPAAILIYFVLTVIRLVLAHSRRLGFWLLTASILFDMALLYGLIWSFHLQYQQPASFYLKAPTLLYVFIFIALRALRFETGYVVLAGIAAALGWLGMIAYVVVVDVGDNMITHDYVSYLTSNSILLGAEFDKIISILVVTALIALAIRRARHLMVQSVVESHAKENLSRFFAPEVARRIGREGDRITAGTGEAREAAILNLDVRGFTRLAARISPPEVMRLLAEYQDLMVQAIQRHGGSIDKFLGDGIMATFGATTPQPDYAARALAALEECIEMAKAWSALRGVGDAPAIAVNGAVAAGRVVVGAVGSESRLEYTVIGEAVNLSAKLEKHNKRQGTRALAHKPAYEAALLQGYRPKAEHRVIEAAAITGVADPIDLVVIAD
jgi:adenylate cyclase